MPDNRDDFTDKTKELMARRAGWRCSNPFCKALTCGAGAAADTAMNVGVAAHICAASPGGKRYDPSMTRETRRHVGNGIWLCQTCAKLIDSDARRYTVALLHEWKARAEKETLRELERGQSESRKTEIPFPERISRLAAAVRSCSGYASVMECLGSLQIEMDALVERMEDLREKVELARRSGDSQWERIYQTQFGHTLSLFDQLSCDAQDMQNQAYVLRKRTEEMNCGAPEHAMAVYMMIDVSGSMHGGSSSVFADSVFTVCAEELLGKLQDGWYRATELEKALGVMFDALHHIELMELAVGEAFIDACSE